MDAGTTTQILLSNDEASAEMIRSVFSVQEGSLMLSMFMGFAFIILLTLLISGFFNLIKPSKSKNYRELITDMYVAGTVRKLATEDKVSLEDEYKAFQKFERKRKSEDKSLDSQIETTLKEKVIERTDKELSAK